MTPASAGQQSSAAAVPPPAATRQTPVPAAAAIPQRTPAPVHAAGGRWRLPRITDRIYQLNQRMLIVFAVGAALLLGFVQLAGLPGIGSAAWLPLMLLVAPLVWYVARRPLHNRDRARANLILNGCAIAATILLVQVTGALQSPFFLLQYLPLLTLGLTAGRRGALAYVGLLLAISIVEFVGSDAAWTGQGIVMLVVCLALMPMVAFLIGDLRHALLEETEKAKLADKLSDANVRLEKFNEQVNKIVGELGALHEFSYLVGMAWEQDDIVDTLVGKIEMIADVRHILVVERRDDGPVVIGTTASLADLAGSREWAADRSAEEWVFMTSEMLLQPKLEERDHAKLPAALAREFTRPMMATFPLVVANEVIGAVTLYSEQREELTDRLMMQLLLTAISQGATSIQNIKTLASLKKAYIEAIRAISMALDAKDAYTKGHSDRVRQYALATADRYGLSARDKEWLDIGAAVHDIGKIGIDDAIIRKDRGLTDDEYAQIKQHPAIGARILEQMVFFEPAVPIMRWHHERWDGKGYPDGIAGDKIPPMARLCAVCDTFDAMTSNRTYRAALATDVAIAELEKNKGTQFAPDAVDAFVATLREDTKLRDEIEERYQVWQFLFTANQDPDRDETTRTA